jgi:deazaflavin-dependent oxidoreductase (nitroreductase family)
VVQDFNKKIIDEFRANAGTVGAPFEGAPMVLLHTTGARSGKPHVTPLVPYLEDGEIYVFASMGGAPRHPAWYHNLVKNPDVTVEQGSERFEATAEVVTGAERDAIYAKQSALRPPFAQYQARTTRIIPVVRLVRRA